MFIVFTNSFSHSAIDAKLFYEDVLYNPQFFIFYMSTYTSVYVAALEKRFCCVAFVDNEDFMKIRRGRTTFVLSSCNSYKNTRVLPPPLY